MSKKKEKKKQVLSSEERLRQINRRLYLRLEELKHKQKELTNAVYRACRDAIGSMDLRFPPKPILVQCGKKKNREEEVVVSVLSDWQLGKKTPTYSTDIARARIRLYAEKLKRIVEIHRGVMPVKNLVVYMLGDMVEGELVFPGQAHAIDASLFRQVSVDGPAIIYEFLTDMLCVFERIKVVCVHGNHGSLGGRSRREYHPESNADRILYKIVEYMFKNCPRVEFIISDSWYYVDRIGNSSFLLFHGDQMRGGGFGGIPFYGFSRALYSWSSGVIREHFDYAICGHWHQGASIPFNFKILWINGSTESYNTYAQEELKSMSAPHQWLLFVHPRHGVTSEYRIWLSSDKYGFDNSE